MAREPSVILSFPLKPIKETKMPRGPKLTLADAKKGLAALKKDTAAAKKAVVEAQKGYLAAPDKISAKEYRTAVSTHISAVAAFEKMADKVAALQNGD